MKYDVISDDDGCFKHFVRRIEVDGKHTTIASFLNLSDAERYAFACENPGLVLPGWTCLSCKGFNGEAKERLERCRTCEGARP